MVGHCRDTLQLGTAGILCGGALRGYLVVEHCRNILRLGSVRIPAVGHCRETLQLGTAGIRGGSALQGYLVVGHCRDTWWLGTAGILLGCRDLCVWAHPLSIAGILIGWALQGYLVVGHCRDTWWLGSRDTLRLDTAGIFGGWSLKSASSRARTTSTLKSNNPTSPFFHTIISSRISSLQYSYNAPVDDIHIFPSNNQ